jgi:hypothetical protein
METLAIGFVWFLMLCALLMLVVPGNRSTQPPSAGETAPTEVHQALGEIEAAAQAFDAANYGKARWHIGQARKALGGLLPASE